MSLVEKMVIAVIVLITALIIFAGYNEMQKPVIEIKKSDWECVKTESRRTSQVVLIGKAMFSMPVKREVCVEYRMRPETTTGGNPAK